MNDYPYFGFQMPGQLPGQSSNPFMNPGASYMGAMPATLGGVGASPMASVQTPATPNMSTLLPAGLMGMQMMNQAHQQPGAQGSSGGFNPMMGVLGGGLAGLLPMLMKGGGGLGAGLGAALGGGGLLGLLAGK